MIWANLASRPELRLRSFRELSSVQVLSVVDLVCFFSSRSGGGSFWFGFILVRVHFGGKKVTSATYDLSTSMLITSHHWQEAVNMDRKQLIDWCVHGKLSEPSDCATMD